MENKILEASEIPEGEKVYLKKSFDGWRVVHPIRNEDGSINYPNLIFGGWWNFIKLIFIMLVVLLVFIGMQELIGNYKEIAKHPCNYCSTAPHTTNSPYIPIEVNFSGIQKT